MITDEAKALQIAATPAAAIAPPGTRIVAEPQRVVGNLTAVVREMQRRGIIAPEILPAEE